MRDHAKTKEEFLSKFGQNDLLNKRTATANYVTTSDHGYGHVNFQVLSECKTYSLTYSEPMPNQTPEEIERFAKQFHADILAAGLKCDSLLDATI